ncbi:hypothetical protein [Gelidibacter japonicus]|uniref:hypothetical protein n=1 Tax=Gelidibacter japonicus TaxID=1962232 RepID=UPI003A8EB54C
MKELIHKIHKQQLKTFCLFSQFYKVKEHYTVLPRKHRGLYWLWTNLDFQTLKTATPRENTKEVPIDKLVTLREDLNNIARVEKDGFKIVYNGIGGYKKTPANFGLRERINQEINCNDHRTGTLNIINRNFKPENWAVTFFDFDDPNNQNILKALNSNNTYIDYAKDLEMIWRLEFGTPILCRH